MMNPCVQYDIFADLLIKISRDSALQYNEVENSEQEIQQVVNHDQDTTL